MSTETYTLQIAEDETHEGIRADLYDEDGLVEKSTRISYGDHGLTAMRDDWEPKPIEREVTADVTTLDLQHTRQQGEFEFRLLGDRDELHSERIADSDWKIASVEE